MQLNQFFGALIVIAIVMFGLWHVPILWRELKFCYKNGWNFANENGENFYLKRDMMQYFYFIPKGLLKIIILSNYIAAGIYFALYLTRMFVRMYT